MGAFKVAPKSGGAKKETTAANKKAPVAAKKSPFTFGKKATPAKQPVVEEKKSVGLFTRMPWQK